MPRRPKYAKSAICQAAARDYWMLGISPGLSSHRLDLLVLLRQALLAPHQVGAKTSGSGLAVAAFAGVDLGPREYI